MFSIEKKRGLGGGKVEKYRKYGGMGKEKTDQNIFNK